MDQLKEVKAAKDDDTSSFKNQCLVQSSFTGWDILNEFFLSKLLDMVRTILKEYSCDNTLLAHHKTF